jgi:hypothetical protein
MMVQVINLAWIAAGDNNSSGRFLSLSDCDECYPPKGHPQSLSLLDNVSGHWEGH